MFKAIFYDLDGTLLPMDTDQFTNYYFSLLTAKMEKYGYDQKDLIGLVWAGTKAMFVNDGKGTNSEVFWKRFVEHYGEEKLKDIELFDEFYRNEFNGAKVVATPKAIVKEVINKVGENGYRQILATQPVFPEIATRNRVDWAGLKYEDFEYVSTYENSHFSKPNPAYYQEMLDRLGLKGEECLMVGNDVDEDGAATKAGMKLFLITDFLINRHNKEIDDIPHGSFEDLMKFLGI